MTLLLIFLVETLKDFTGYAWGKKTKGIAVAIDQQSVPKSFMEQHLAEDETRQVLFLKPLLEASMSSFFIAGHEFHSRLFTGTGKIRQRGTP